MKTWKIPDFWCQGYSFLRQEPNMIVQDYKRLYIRINFNIYVSNISEKQKSDISCPPSASLFTGEKNKGKLCKANTKYKQIPA